MSDGKSIDNYHRSYVSDQLLAMAPDSEEDIRYVLENVPEWMAKTLDLVVKSSIEMDDSNPDEVFFATPWISFRDATEQLALEHIGDIRYEAVISHAQPQEGTLLHLGSVTLGLIGRSVDAEDRPGESRMLAVLTDAGVFIPDRWQGRQLDGHRQVGSIFDMDIFGAKGVLLPRDRTEEAIKKRDLAADQERKRRLRET
ncbi:MAG TPA: hypothetical protein VMR28_00735 [Candidatus Saccharimonadales bacterium]|nr:hypothetical protein [Candidatus Saccharimonadales bacterium]